MPDGTTANCRSELARDASGESSPASRLLPSALPADLPLTDARCAEFFLFSQLPARGPHRTLRAWWEAQTWDFRTESGWDYERLREGIVAFLGATEAVTAPAPLRSLEILRGRDKSGQPEKYDLCFKPGDVVCLVGPTGAGKSRFLADIECLAQGDTPTGRIVRIDGRAPDPESRFTGEGRIVAQITQNMNFVMDLAVAEFLRMHAESRALAAPESAMQRVLDAAIHMAGEPFGPETPLTQLSGGQSRALMIADAAFLSPKPVVLIDEIENAGVDRTRALEFFVDQGKIVLLSTHDPLLALSGARRLVIRHGAVQQVIEPSPQEEANRVRLATLDRRLARLRERLRLGERLDEPREILLGDTAP
jgi:ABC-type lipoprotein export system ATPase subunit